MATNLIIFGVCAASFIAVLGLLCILFLIFNEVTASKKDGASLAGVKNTAILFVAGSGGHTKELLCLVKQLKSHYKPRYYVMANTDKMSENKITKMESTGTGSNEYTIYKIPRSREVKQSWISTVLSTLYASLYSFPLVFKLCPEIILCNGPGTCIPICFAGLLLKVLFYPIKIIYVESICRVETLSMSGKILYRFADEVIVQWPQLQQKYPKTRYMGRIV